MDNSGETWAGCCPVSISRPPCQPRTVHVAAFCPHTMLRDTWRAEDYEEVEQLYQGKASVLHAAKCRISSLPVALKKYRKERLSNLNWHQVEREIRIHSRLQHPNIVQLYASFEDNKYVYLVQEYAAGGDLYEELKRLGGQLPDGRTAGAVLAPCLEGLAYLHAQGIIHRDIKPENILLTSDHIVKLADFGLSLDYNEERPVTRAGTLDYMSPEVLLCPEKSRPEENKEKSLLHYTKQVDAWAMGILAYELLVGRAPFQHKHRAETYEHIMYRKPLYVPWMSEGARGFISAALNKAPKKRPSVAAMLEDPWIRQHAAEQAAIRRSTMDIAGMLSRSGSELSSDTQAGNTVAQMDTSGSETHQGKDAVPMDCREDSAQGAGVRCMVRDDSFGVSRPQSVLQWAGASVKQLRKLLSKGSASASAADGGSGSGRDTNPDAMLQSSTDEGGSTGPSSNGSRQSSSTRSSQRVLSPFASITSSASPCSPSTSIPTASCMPSASYPALPASRPVTPPATVGLLSPPKISTSNYQQKMSFEELMAKGNGSDLFRNGSSPYAGDGGPLQATGSRIKAWHRGDAETASPSQQPQQGAAYRMSPPSPQPFSPMSSSSSMASPLAVRRGRIAGADSHLPFLDAPIRNANLLHQFGRAGSAADPLQACGLSPMSGAMSNGADGLRGGWSGGPDAPHVGNHRAAVPRSKSFLVPGHKVLGYAATGQPGAGEVRKHREREW